MNTWKKKYAQPRTMSQKLANANRKARWLRQNQPGRKFAIRFDKREREYIVVS